MSRYPAKINRGLKIVLWLFCGFWFSMSASAAKQEIIFWHSMAGQLGDEVARLTAQFNKSQPNYRVKPIYKGDYVESLTSFAAAFRAKNPPNLVQVFEVGTSAMARPVGIIKPVETIINEQGLTLSKDAFYTGVLERYSANGLLLALPFNVSVPVMFYNADRLKRFGVTEKTFPRTWAEFERLANRIRQAGDFCVYTSAYPAWVLVESYYALHGLSQSNQSDSDKMASHLRRMRRWQMAHFFEYGGRGDDATALFTSGKCLIFSQSSGAYQGLRELVPFEVGVAALPFDDTSNVKRQNNVIGGAALWVPAGQSREVERGIADFMVFLSKPAIQQEWFEHTGYLPMNHVVQNQSNSILNIAKHDLNQIESKRIGTDAGGENQIRTIYDQMLESIFSGMMPVHQAMDRAQRRIHHVLARFKRNTS